MFHLPFFNKPNVIQAEFFIDSLMIKTCLRFYEGRWGGLSRLVSRHSKLEKRSREAVNECLSRRLQGSHNVMKYHRAMLHNRREAARLVLRRIAGVAYEPNSIAIETVGHAYRFVEPSEIHEILQRVRGASGEPWIFVFEPNNLLADNNKVIASIM